MRPTTSHCVVIADLLLPAEGDGAATAAGLESSDVGACDATLISIYNQVSLQKPWYTAQRRNTRDDDSAMGWGGGRWLSDLLTPGLEVDNLNTAIDRLRGAAVAGAELGQ